MTAIGSTASLSAERYDAHRSITAAIRQANLGRTAALEVLDACRRQIETRALAERAITGAGYRCKGFLWNRDLEMYLDIQDEHLEIAFLAKGWSDPGFRLGQVVRLPPNDAAHDNGVERLRRFCTLNGVVITVGKNPEGIEVVLEYLIYSAGFNAESLSAALDTLRECTTSASPSMLEMDSSRRQG